MGQGPAESLSLRRDSAASGVVLVERPAPEAAPVGWAAPEAAPTERPTACRALLAGEPADRCPLPAEELLARRPLPADADVSRWSFPRRACLPPRTKRGRCEDCCAMIPSFLLVVDQYYVMGPGPRADVPFCFHHLGTLGVRGADRQPAPTGHARPFALAMPPALCPESSLSLNIIWVSRRCRVFSAGCAAAACPFWRSGYD